MNKKLPIVNIVLLIIVLGLILVLRGELSNLRSEMVNQEATNTILVESIKLRDKEIVELERKLEEEKWIY